MGHVHSSQPVGEKNIEGHALLPWPSQKGVPFMSTQFPRLDSSPVLHLPERLGEAGRGDIAKLQEKKRKL